MSSRVRASAVAVTARRGTPGNSSARRPRRAVVGAEVVAPLADAVGLVDGDQGESSRAQPLQHPRLHQPFRRRGRAGRARRPRSARQVSARSSAGRCWSPAARPRRPAGVSAATWSAISAISGETTRPTPRPHQARDLVADALAAAGRQHRQGVAPGQHLADHRRLQPAEIRMAEDAAQKAPGLLERGGIVDVVEPGHRLGRFAHDGETAWGCPHASAIALVTP